MAIEHSRQRYAGDPVTFEVCDLGMPLPAGDGIFDLVFSSNVFEHVANVNGLAAECARVMAPDGLTVVAVPPICSAETMASDMTNAFHVHHIPPAAWAAKLQRFFTEVRCHAHTGAGAFAEWAQLLAEWPLPPDQVTIREADFAFPETTPDAMAASGETITALFVCRGRRVPPGPETLAERTPAAWQEGAAAARLIARTDAGEARTAAMEARANQAEARAAQAETHAAALESEVSMLRNSTSWRVTGPLRRLGALRHR